jgi:hypothetical protein
MKEKTHYIKRKFNNNFFLLNEEKDLIFTLKKLHRLNNRLGNDDESYIKFIEKMSCYYKDIMLEYGSR